MKKSTVDFYVVMVKHEEKMGDIGASWDIATIDDLEYAFCRFIFPLEIFCLSLNNLHHKLTNPVLEAAAGCFSPKCN